MTDDTKHDGDETHTHCFDSPRGECSMTYQQRHRHQPKPNAGHELLVGALDEKACVADARQRRLKRLQADERGHKAKAVVCTP